MECYFKSLTIVDDKVEMHDIEYETNSLEFDLQYSENENRYYYTIGDKDKKFVFITIDNIEKKENLSIPKEDNISESISDDELIELTKEKFNSYEAYQKMILIKLMSLLVQIIVIITIVTLSNLKIIHY